MYLRPDGKKAYQVIVDPEMLSEMQEAKRRGLNLQPLIREYIRACLDNNKKEQCKADAARAE